MPLVRHERERQQLVGKLVCRRNPDSSGKGAPAFTQIASQGVSIRVLGHALRITAERKNVSAVAMRAKRP